MRYATTLAILLIIPAAAIAQSKPTVRVAGDGFPTGHETPEGAAADLARAIIAKDPEAFRKVSVRVHGKGPSAKDYEAFLKSVMSDIASEKARAAASPVYPRALGKVFAVRQFSRNGPASYGHASFGFQSVAFVDVGVLLNNGQRSLNRTLVIKDRDAKWYAHPAPHVSPLLSSGLNEEPPSQIDFSEVYRVAGAAKRER